eukprot:GFUD01001606.1.p1 GENE.GFUD01001606.1~~GFUD01001606.1.p1  ORF type:complete len:1654 (-),score=563.80 GFUD01001606.1:789-5750(-)
MVRKSIRNKCKSSNPSVIVDVDPGKTQPKKFLKVRSFKDLQSEEVKLEENLDAAMVSDNSETVPISGQKRQVGDDLIPDETSENKKLKLEIKIELTEDSSCLAKQSEFIPSSHRPPAASSTAKLSSVQVLGYDLFYRHYGSMVLFKTSSVMDMLSKSLPLSDSSLLENVVDKSGGAQNALFLEDTWKRAFISWNALRVIINGGLLDLAIRDLLLSARVQGDIDSDIQDEQVSRCNSLQDNLVINMIEVKFKVRGGTVYLEVLSAFTALDRLHEALEGCWTKVDQLLASQGLSQKAAFKKRGAGRAGGLSAGGGLSRNYMTLQAFCIISQGHKARDRVKSLVKMVDQLKEKEKSICREIQQTVDMILRTSCIVPGEKVASLSLAEEGESQLGHKYCGNSLCGRGYHFVMRCCGKSHVLRLGGQAVGYVRKKGRIFLEKCAAFGVLGKMYVIRCSDYRKTDKILLEKCQGETVESNFLFEHDDVNLGRNRRTHVSLDAFITLVQAGFADPCKYETLVSCVDKVREEYQDNRRDSCEEMEVIDLSDSDVEVDDKMKMNAEESSSGIESEEFSPTTPRKSFKDPESDGDFDNDVRDFVDILGTRIATKAVDNKVFLEKTSVLTLVDSPSLLQKGHRAVDKLLEENGVCLDEAFLYEGRQRGFISSTALKIVLKSELLQEFEQRAELLQEISKLEKSADLMKECQLLVLKSFDNIRFRLVGGTVHLDSLKLLKLAGFSSSYVYQAPSKANLLLCKILSDRGVNTQHCFVKHGKSKYAFISLSAAHTLLRSEMGPLKDGERTKRLTEEIFDALKKQEIIKNVPDVIEKGIKVSEDFQPIRYKVEAGKLFLHRKSCFECLGLESAVLSSKKGYTAINSILVLGGLDLTSCYIATKQQRYSYISCLALVHLLQSRDPLMVCLRNKEQFLAGLLAALQAGAVAALGLEGGQATLQLEGEVAGLEFQCQNSVMYLHRHTAYTMAGLYDQADWTDQDIYDDPTGPLAERGVDPGTSFLADGGDRFAWLSLHSLFVLMGCGPSMGEGGGDSYQTVAWRDLLSAVALQEPRLRNHIKMDNFKTILMEKVTELYIQFIEKDTEVVGATGNMDPMEIESGVESGTDSGHISAAGLVAVGDILEIVDNGSTSTKDMVARSEHIDLEDNLTGEHMTKGEQKTTDITIDSKSPSVQSLSPTDPVPAISVSHHSSHLPLLSPEQQVPNSAPPSPLPHINLHSPSSSNAPSPYTSCLPSPTGSLPDETCSLSLPQFPSLTPARYAKLQSDILSAAGGVGGHIGDWQVGQSGQVTTLSVRPGYGASRKGSFLHPDYAAILRYTLTLAPGMCSLTINEQEINTTVLDTILDRGEKEGTLSFLYQLISLRPCFGSFSPELVETVSQSLDRQDTSQQLGQLYIDTKFIGTSSSGRTYAGTVRAKECEFLAADRVSDCCSHCKLLDRLTINRSILGQEEVVKDEADKGGIVEGGKTGQKSVWQLATTSEDGCNFLCPQVQSFNTSLPHAFDGSAQATTIVNHRVEISNNLKVQVELSNRSVSRTFPEFQKSRQLGPLLDWVAGLRLCVGYPNMQLVQQATFIIQNMARLKPDMRKLFKFLAVDEKFIYQSEMVQSGGGESAGTVGTIRAGSCLVTAETGADICHQCRLLQEPIEFLAV